MANGQCICATLPQLADSLVDGKLARVFLYTHHDEMHRRLSTNTGKLLQLVLGHHRVRRVVLGQHTQELSMVRELGEAMRSQKSLFPLSRCFVLFPSQCSLTLDEVLPYAGRRHSPLAGSMKANREALGEGLTVVLLDGTWNDGKALNKRLDVLLSIYLRDFDRSEIDTSCFPFCSHAEREYLLLAKCTAESGAQFGEGAHQDSEATAPFTNSRVSLGGRKGETTSAILPEGGAGDTTRLDSEWQQLLPRVRLSGGAAQIATGAGPSLRKHDQRHAKCDHSGGGAMPAAATSSTFALKERVGTASAFAILLSELGSLEHSDSEVPAEQIPAASVSTTADVAEGHEAAQASTTGINQSQAYISSSRLSSASARVDCRRSLFYPSDEHPSSTPAMPCSREGSARLEDTQEGSASEWWAMSDAVLMALEIQAEAFKRQMHGVK